MFHWILEAFNTPYYQVTALQSFAVSMIAGAVIFFFLFIFGFFK